MDRIIYHCDCNSFFASVEELDNPELKKYPMAVAGDPESRHGIILAKNEKAKAYHIQTAETIWQAKSKCPSLILVPPRHHVYDDISKRINKIYLEYTDLVEPASIDESYLDVTNSIHLFPFDAVGLADELRRRTREDIGITISVGVSFCKTIAKFGSDYKKPDATTVLTRDVYRKVMDPLPVGDLLMVGRKTAEKLRTLGIETIGQLAAAPLPVLEKHFGKFGTMISEIANGKDNEPVRSFYEEREVKSIGHSMTFRRDLSGEEEMRAGINALADSVAARLRRQDKKCTVVQLGIKDPQLHTIQRQVQLNYATDLQKEIAKTAMALLKAHWPVNKPVRLLSITAMGLLDAEEDFYQADMFAQSIESHEKQEVIEDTIGQLREKFGKSVIRFGHFKDEETGIK